MRRRDFMQGSLSALFPLGGAAIGCTGDPPEESAPTQTSPPLATPLTTVGLQLYTVRELLAQDFAGTLAQVAELGYREVEVDNTFGVAPSALRVMLDDLGLSAPAGHFSIEVFQNTLAETIENALVVGHRYLVLPFLPHALRTADGYRQAAATLNAAGLTAQQSGLEVVFHNHDFDFTPLPEGGELGFDILMAEVDPNLVRVELDVYWISITGNSAVDYLQRYSGRYRLCHLKDMTEYHAMTDVGYGTLDWASIIAAAQAAGVLHFIVEHDQPSDALASAERSYAYLTGTST